MQDVIKYGLTGFVRGVLNGKADVSRFNLEKLYQYAVMYAQNGILTSVLDHAKEKDLNLVQPHSGYGSFNPLFFALKDQRSDFQQFKFLVQLGGDIHSTDMVGNTMLHLLYQGVNNLGQKELQILDYLLNRG